MRSQNAILAAIFVTRYTDPAARVSLIKVLDNYTAVYRKGCTPPDATGLEQHRQQRGVLARAISSAPSQLARDEEA